MSDEILSEIYEHGSDAFSNYGTIALCPYDPANDYNKYYSWWSGFNDQRKFNTWLKLESENELTE